MFSKSTPRPRVALGHGWDAPAAFPTTEHLLTAHAVHSAGDAADVLLAQREAEQARPLAAPTCRHCNMRMADPLHSAFCDFA